MLGRQERTAILLLIGVAVVVIVAHVVLTNVGKQSFAHAFTNTSADGELVYLEGTIEQTSLTKTGGHVTLRIRNLTVFVPAQAARDLTFQKGQRISLYGVAETYRGEKEIVVGSAGDINFFRNNTR
jgi:DNA/RNA endonuclease YhcR with UshA esterase domain